MRYPGTYCATQPDKVLDVAVFGLPDPGMGEFVQAVVQLMPGVQPGVELAEELRAYARGRLAGYKVPRRIDFRDELPRLPTGKLAKRVLRDEFLAAIS
jgi:long-chain acyl-CoA synthetase